MRNHQKIGIIIADEGEFAPVKAYEGEHLQKEERTLWGMPCMTFLAKKGERTLQMDAVLCGVGLSNAAAATAFLLAEGASAIVNEGLSGALHGLRRGQPVLGTAFVQHDFDAAALGYRPGVICGEPCPIPSDSFLTPHFAACCPGIKQGLLASGNCFVSSTRVKEQLVKNWKAVACDMESSAIALICTKQKIPFAVLRQAADDAGEGAGEVYREINAALDSSMFGLVMEGLLKLFEAEPFWAD